MKFEVIKSTEQPFDPEHSTFMQELNEVIEHEKKILPSDFYVMSVPRVEEWPRPVYKKRFIAREICPMPYFEQSVWKYHRRSEKLEFLWSIPPKEWAEAIRQDPINCPPDILESRDQVLDYYSGKLRNKAIELNAEDKLKSEIALRSYSDDQMEKKEKHAKIMKEIHDQRKRTKLY